MKTAIIGGGWAGLAAAITLTEHGHPPTLFEAGRHLGGRARKIAPKTTPEIAQKIAPHTTFTAPDNAVLDNGQHILLGAYGETLRLMRTVGADPDALLHRLPLHLEVPGVFRLALPKFAGRFAGAARLRLAWGLLTAQGPSLGEKLQTALWMQQLERRHFRLEKDCSVSEWLDHAGQTGILRQQLWEPLCLAALNTPPERASAQIFLHVLQDSLGSPQPRATDLLIPKTHLSALLPEPAHIWLTGRGARIETGHRVKKIAFEAPPGTASPSPACSDTVANTVANTEANTAAAGGWIDGQFFERIIIAVAPQHLHRLLPELGPEPEVARQFEPIGTVYLYYPPELTLPRPMLALGGSGDRIGQWIIDRGQGVMGASLSGHGHWEALTDEQLAESLHQELCQLLKQPLPLQAHRVIREQRATFACTPDLKRPGTHTPLAGLFLAGDYTYARYPATLEGAVLSGRLAAEAVLATLPKASQ